MNVNICDEWYTILMKYESFKYFEQNKSMYELMKVETCAWKRSCMHNCPVE